MVRVLGHDFTWCFGRRRLLALLRDALTLLPPRGHYVTVAAPMHRRRHGHLPFERGGHRGLHAPPGSPARRRCRADGPIGRTRGVPRCYDLAPRSTTSTTCTTPTGFAHDT